jgi:hypothetical protein
MNPDLMEDLHIFGTIGVFILWAWDYSIYLYIDDIRHIMGMGPGILLYRRYPNPIILLIHCAWHDQPWAYQAGTSLTMIVAIKSTSSSIYISIYIYIHPWYFDYPIHGAFSQHQPRKNDDNQNLAGGFNMFQPQNHRDQNDHPIIPVATKERKHIQKHQKPFTIYHTLIISDHPASTRS